MSNLPPVDDTNQKINSSKTPTQGEKQNINTTDNDNFDYLAPSSQSQSPKKFLPLNRRFNSSSNLLKPSTNKTSKDQKPKYHSDDQDTDKPSSAEVGKPEKSNPPSKSSQLSEANPSSEIDPDSTPAADKEWSYDEASLVQQLQNPPEEQMKRDYEAEAEDLKKEIKSKTRKTVLVLTASGLAIGGAAVACLILLSALPIYACGVIGVAIGAAIGLLIFAIVRGMSGRAELDAKYGPQIFLSNLTSKIDFDQQICTWLNNVDGVKNEDILHMNLAIQLALIEKVITSEKNATNSEDEELQSAKRDLSDTKLILNLGYPNGSNFKLDSDTATSDTQQMIEIKNIPDMLKEGKKVMWNQALPNEEPVWVELTEKNIN